MYLGTRSVATEAPPRRAGAGPGPGGGIGYPRWVALTNDVMSGLPRLALYPAGDAATIGQLMLTRTSRRGQLLRAQ